MTWFGPSAEVEIVEDVESLVVRVKNLTTWLNSILPLLILGAVNYGFIKDGHPWIILAFDAAAAIGALESFSRRGEVQELFITAEYLRSNSEGRIRWEEMSYLRYQQGGEDEPSGLYAKRRWARVCLLQGLSQEQGDEIVQRIFGCFPTVPMADDDGPPSMFGKASDPITLGLSKRGD